ncbi:Hydroquinone glucosyltransferase [Morus notabilis]|uniref:Glycosyltransferase n=1 Tax=Morus notabilis TaxID=981085 RepID=W9RBJ8_9ROSA|nr:hydroquinone glucosyltransferase [Morus notabilis]EXB66639.1 Hydroquinone glucosyltransferase [Morus notabilis]
MDQPQTQTRQHVAILPSPGMGHVIPMVEFAKRFVRNHNFTVTFLVPTSGSPSTAMRSVFNGLPDSIEHVFLPPVNFDDLPEGSKLETRIALTVVRSLASLRDALASLFSRRVGVVALVVDHFGLDAFDVAREFNLPSYLFYPSPAMVLSLILHLPELDESTSSEYWELTDPVKIPGCFPIPGKDLLDPIQDRKSDVYKLTLHKAKQYRLVDGIIVNTFNDLEPRAISSLQEREATEKLPRVYPVGPLAKIQRTNLTEEESQCLIWLDGQPRVSVLFISFGSGGTLSSDQTNELALGLENSEQRFLWVVRPPNDRAASAAYFKVNSQNESSFDFLPDGFLGRTRDRGLVVHSWAPQAQILSHSSIGGFLTHCGWNSILESMVNGVPMIVWPLFAEQRMNAFMLTEDIKVALRPKASENGVVEREEIARVIKALMEGGEDREKLRKRIEELKEAGSTALTEDGNSTKALADVADVWKSQIRN